MGGALGLRNELKDKNYGNPPRRLLPGEKAIFDKLPPNADKETIRKTARLLETAIKIYWSGEELNQDDDDFKFAKKFCEKQSTDENERKIFQLFEVKGIGNLIKDFVFELSILKFKVKELEKEKEKLDSDLEEKRKVLKDEISELERRERILFFVKRNGAENRKVSIPKRIKKVIQKKKILRQNLEKFLSLYANISNLDQVPENEKKPLIETVREWRTKVIPHFPAEKTPGDEERESQLEEKARQKSKELEEKEAEIEKTGKESTQIFEQNNPELQTKLDVLVAKLEHLEADREIILKEYREILKKIDEEKLRKKILKEEQSFRDEFLVNVPYRFAELFWVIKDDLEEEMKDFLQTLKTHPFFEGIQNNLPEDYFTKGWKPERSVPKDKTKLAEIERILELMTKVDRWCWKAYRSEFEEKEIVKGSGKTYIEADMGDSVKLDETPRVLKATENFSLAEANDLNPVDFFRPLFNGTFASEKHWPTLTLELREFFFFFEELFPRNKNDEENPLLKENGFINGLLRKYCEKNGRNFTMWKQTLTFLDEVDEFNEEIDFLKEVVIYIKTARKSLFYDDSMYKSEILEVKKAIGEENGFIDLYRSYFFDLKFTEWGEYPFRSGLFKKRKAGNYLQSLFNHRTNPHDANQDQTRMWARIYVKAIEDLKTLIEEEKLAEKGYVDKQTDLKAALVFLLSGLEKHEKVFKESYVRVEEQEIEVSEIYREKYEVFAKELEMKISREISKIFKTRYISKVTLNTETSGLMSDLWEPFEDWVLVCRKKIFGFENEIDETKREKRNKKGEIQQSLKPIEEKEKKMAKLSTLFSQQTSKVGNTEKIESFSQFIFRSDSLGHQIFWTGFFIVITNTLALLYFYWNKIVAWWNKSPLDWILEEKEKSE